MKDSIENLRRRTVDIHFLMLAVAVGAASIGAWGEGILLLFLFSSSEAIEAFVTHRTRRAIDSLFKEQPQTALALDAEGNGTVVPVDSVRAGHLLLVRPGDVFPVDGVVQEGESETDESSFSGEALPVFKKMGDEVLGGTANLWGVLKIRVLRGAGESMLQRIIHLIQDAQKHKAPTQSFIDRFGSRYTLFALGMTLAMFFVWWLVVGLPPFVNTPEGTSAFYRAMTLLVVSSPCALVLSIPSAIMAAIACGARRGILFKGGGGIEKLASVDCVAMDKTGTLTTGELSVERVDSFPPGRAQAVLGMAAALEANATHPVARAITAHGQCQVAVGSVTAFKETHGRGVEGVVDGVYCALGRREFVEGKTGLAGVQAGAQGALAEEHSEVWLGSEGLVGRIVLCDKIRDESAVTLAELERVGVRTVMLTGDRLPAAQGVGARLGIREIMADLSPAEKAERVRELASRGHRVAMLGDGVNDAPSLAAAHVAVGMGARGAGVSLEQCDVVLVNDRLDLFLDARELGLRTRSVIRQNLAISLGTIFVMVSAGIGIGVPLSLGVLAHEGSTVFVCLNSLRLLLRRRAARCGQ
ncbi:MAG: cation-translocating P-type ATPase [Puniceicoccales bacterium]|nr:cation-translocating P-type ATPase [Puniceicoccales bacterium]